MKIRIINRSDHGLPKYETDNSAGMDIKAFINKDIILRPLERAIVTTGLYLSLPNGHEAQVRPRSGLAIKKGISVLNSPGTIDSDYRGEIGVILINLSNEEFKVKNGDRIAQLIIAKHESISWDEVEKLEDSPRGSAGFGSTGL